MKKYLFALFHIILCAVLLAGCEPDFSENDRAFRELSRQSGLTGSTITLMASSDWITDAEMHLGTDFEAATGIQVVYNLYPDDVYLDTLFEKLDSDNPPDLFMTQSGMAIKNTYQLDQYSVDLSEEPWMDSYDSFSAAETSIDGRNYGMAYFDNTTDYYMVYNKKIFKRAGVTEIPATYDSFIRACRKISDTGAIPIYEPMADGWHQTMLFAENGQVFEKSTPGITQKLNDNETTFARTASMKQALDQIQELAQKGYMGKNFRTDTFDNATGYMANGEYAMCMLKPGSIDAIVSSDMNTGYKKEDFGILLLPVCDNQILNIHPTTPSKFISSASEHIAAAKLYLQYISTKESVQYVIDHAETVDNLPFSLGQTPNYSDATTHFLGQFDAAHSGLVLQDVVTYFNEQWGEIGNDILDMCEGKMSSGEVLGRIDARRAELAKTAGDPKWN